MSRPTVAYVLKMFPRFSETFILAELLELERQGVRLEVFSLRPPNDAQQHADLQRLQARVRQVPQAAWHNVVTLLSAHLRLAVRHPRRYAAVVLGQLRRRRRESFRHFVQAGWVAARAESAGVGHVHAHFASMATSVARRVADLTGVGYSFTAHAKDIYIDGVDERALAAKLRDARFTVTVSDFNQRFLRGIRPTARIVRIYNGLDLEQFRLSGRVRGGDGAAPLIMAVGRLIEKKGFADLVDACRVLCERGLRFRCAIVGSGDLRGELSRQIARHQLDDMVELVGPLPRERLLELLPQASVLAAPCVVGRDGNRDGLPTVLLEAMAVGVPVVATDVTGIPELVVHERSGLLVSQHAPTELADAVQRLLLDEGLASRLAGAGRREIEHRFDLRRNVQELRRLLLEEAA